MDKRTEIREGIARELARKRSGTAGSNESAALEKADYILKYLDSQGLRLPNGEPLIESKV